MTDARGAFTPEWLVGRRWFRSKQRPVAAVSVADDAPLAHAELLVLEIAYADGGLDHYFVPAIEGREPLDGEGAWRAMLSAIADELDVASRRGRYSGTRAGAMAEVLPVGGSSAAALEERSAGVEQSNSSIVLGDRLMLKVYRRLEPGLNPDLEVSAFLAEVGFAETPALAGYLTYEANGGQSAVAAMVQSYIPSTGDAWAAMLEALASGPEHGIAMAATIGGLTARMHAALASRPDDPAFPSRAATPEEAARWRASAERQLSEAVTAVSGSAHERLVALAPSITRRFADTFGSIARQTPVSRIHGDYHLGQLLRAADGGFSVLDFEGEPARPLSERRAPGSPLRDVAGLLRSLDYAARSAESAAHVPGFDVARWLGDARRAFLGAYGPIPEESRALLAAFELEKACYEVRYEANNRPDWLWLPLAAVARIAAE